MKNIHKFHLILIKHAQISKIIFIFLLIYYRSLSLTFALQNYIHYRYRFIYHFCTDLRILKSCLHSMSAPELHNLKNLVSTPQINVLEEFLSFGALKRRYYKPKFEEEKDLREMLNMYARGMKTN